MSTLSAPSKKSAIRERASSPDRGDGGRALRVGARAATAAVARGCGDRRVSQDVRPGLSTMELVAWQTFRAAILLLTGDRPHGQPGAGLAVSRRWIADMLDVSEHTLEDWISPAGSGMPRLDAFAAVLDMVPAPEMRMGVMEGLMAALDLDVRPFLGKVRQERVTSRLLGLGASLGELQAKVRHAMAPEGDGGRVMTADERAGIAEAAGALARAAEELREQVM